MSLLFAPAGGFEGSLFKRCPPDKQKGNGWKSCTPSDWLDMCPPGSSLLEYRLGTALQAFMYCQTIMLMVHWIKPLGQTSRFFPG